MSKRMADLFFPASLDHINKNPLLRFIYHEIIFPETVAQQCPEYVCNIRHNINWKIRQPFLLLSALCGVWIGCSGWHQLLSKQTPTKTTISQPQTLWWAASLLTFGLMNVSAVFVHCLWPAPTTNYPTDFPMCWAVDTYMTGVSGTFLLGASLKESQSKWTVEPTKNSSIRSNQEFVPLRIRSMLEQLPIHHLLVAIQSLGVLCIVWFAMDPASEILVASRPLELWYLTPPIVAGPPVVVFVYENILVFWFKSYTDNESQSQTSPAASKPADSPTLSLGQVVFATSILVIGVLGIIMDRLWCSWLGSSLARDFLSANTLVFLGCDCAFWGLTRVLIERQQQQQQQQKSQHPHSVLEKQD